MDDIRPEFVDFTEHIPFIPGQGKPVFARHQGRARRHPYRGKAVDQALHACGRIGGAHYADRMPKIGKAPAKFIDGDDLSTYPWVIGIGKKYYSHLYALS
jgi:hypothetical protein